MKPIAFLSWLYDIKLDAKGIRFVLFSLWTVYLLPFENIKSVNEISNYSWGSLNAYNFKNRLFARSFMIEMHRGWFARKVLITPKYPSELLAYLREHAIS